MGHAISSVGHSVRCTGCFFFLPASTPEKDAMAARAATARLKRILLERLVREGRVGWSELGALRGGPQAAVRGLLCERGSGL